MVAAGGGVVAAGGWLLQGCLADSWDAGLLSPLLHEKFGTIWHTATRWPNKPQASCTPCSHNLPKHTLKAGLF